MILPEDMQHVAPRFAEAGLTAHLVESDEPDLTDDQIEIFRDGVDTRVYIQIALVGGGYYVNESRGEGAALVIRDHGEFRSLRKAIDRAIAVIRSNPNPNATKKEV
ncbi:MAG TPA: hypothetical protein VLE97_06630 [Gaiellaceae bacterium]|nr:hypothetical protein [Gaiellaceae bacterium]